MLAKPFFEHLDSNKAGKVTEAEFLAGMKKLFAEWDKDKNGMLDQRELTDGLQKMLPAPQMGPGPPGKGPDGFPVPKAPQPGMP